MREARVREADARLAAERKATQQRWQSGNLPKPTSALPKMPSLFGGSASADAPPPASESAPPVAGRE